MRSLGQADRAGVRFLVPVRTEYRLPESYIAGSEGLRQLRYVAESERLLGPSQRTR